MRSGDQGERRNGTSQQSGRGPMTDNIVPGKKGRRESERLKREKMLAKMTGPIPVARDRAPKSAPCIAPCMQRSSALPMHTQYLHSTRHIQAALSSPQVHGHSQREPLHSAPDSMIHMTCKHRMQKQLTLSHIGKDCIARQPVSFA